MLRSDRCGNGLPLTAGINIMGRKAISSTSRSIVIKRGNTVLINNDFYVPGEALTVSISNPSSIEYLFETSGARFIGSRVGCSGTRFYDESQSSTVTTSLKLPVSGKGDVKVWAGWAISESTVSISSSFILQETPTTLPPSSSPITTQSPVTVADSSFTYSPLYSDSDTYAPLLSADASSTVSPSYTSQNPASNTGSSSSSSSLSLECLNENEQMALIVGVIGGVLFLIAVLSICFYQSTMIKDTTPEAAAVNYDSLSTSSSPRDVIVVSDARLYNSTSGSITL